MVRSVVGRVEFRGAARRLYGGIGTAIRSANSAGLANNGAIKNTAKPAVCNATEIRIAQRLIFLSLAFLSGSHSTRQPLKVPAHGSAFTRSSLDITHLPKLRFGVVLRNPEITSSREIQICRARLRRLPCSGRRGARRDVRCARPHALGHRMPASVPRCNCFPLLFSPCLPFVG